MNFTEALYHSSPLILDGAMGTELHKRGVSIELPLWSARAIIENPEIIEKIHIDYLNAGADIITTNTFRTDTRTFRKANLSENDARSATKQAIDIAKNAIKSSNSDKDIWIAGSMSTLEDCYHPELSPDYEIALAEHREKASWLAESGANFILIETMNTFNEALAAVNAALETGLPVIVSFILNNECEIFNGDNLYDAYCKLQGLGIDGFSINCSHHSLITEFLFNYTGKIDLPIVVYANAGFYTKEHSWQDDPDFTPEFYADKAYRWINMGAKIVGGCCGTSIDHINAISEIINIKKGPV